MSFGDTQISQIDIDYCQLCAMFMPVHPEQLE